jgi:hypothetical protein
MKMCKPASGVFVKGHIAYWLKNSDSHEEIIREHKLNADGIRGTNVVRFEVTPPNGDMSKPLKDWHYALDDSMGSCLPEWYDAKAAEKSARKMLKDWAKQKLITGNVERLTDGDYYISGNATVKHVSGDATVKHVSGNATVKHVSGNATVKHVYDNATVKHVSGNATVESVYGNATVESVYGNATVKYVYGDATVKYVYGDATVKHVYGDATVKHVYDNATVESVYDNATVKSAKDQSTVTIYVKRELGFMQSANCVCIDRSVSLPKCYVGIQKG